MVTVSPILAQVMKIIMTLTVEEAGRVHYVKRPGALLEAGCVIARLELDDPTKVKPVSLPGAGYTAVPSHPLPSDIPRGTVDVCWGTEQWSRPDWGISRDVSPCWHSHGRAASPSRLRWGTRGCCTRCRVVLCKHPLHTHLVCRSSHASFWRIYSTPYTSPVFLRCFRDGHWQRHEAECWVLPLYLTKSRRWRGCAGFSGAAAALGGAPSRVSKDLGQPTSPCSLQAQPFTGGLPAQQTLPITGEKQHQVLRHVLDNLTNVMNGYCLPEPYFSTKVGAGAKVVRGSCPIASCLP